VNLDSGWFQGWYFDLRLEEEVARSVRHGLQLTVLVIILEHQNGHQDRQLLNLLLSDIAERKLRRSDIPGAIADRVYAVSLPHTTPAQAEVVASRLIRWFKPYTAAIGKASLPEDCQAAVELFQVAQERARIVAAQGRAA
jgi:GGDEF domain-containing protein